MKRVLPLLALLLLGGWTESWESIRAAGATVQAVTAEFVQEKRLPILAKPLVSRGRFWFRRPGSLRWAYDHPLEIVLLVHGGKIRRFARIESRWVQDGSVSAEALRVVLGELQRWLRGAFHESRTFTPELRPGAPTQVVLRPRDEGMKRFLQEIVLTLGERPGEVARVEIVEDERSRTVLRFQKLEMNPTIPDERFERVE